MASATIVSFAPLPINEFKPQMNPEYISIPAAKQGDFEIIHVEDSHYYLYLDDERGSRAIPEPVSKWAESIVNDYALAQILRDSSTGAGPGIFWVEGKLSKEDIVKRYPDKLKEAADKQKRWFVRLVEAANDGWAVNRQHNNISELQKCAARALNLEPEWLHTETSFGNVKCVACFSIVAEGAVICPNCHFVLNPEKYKTMQFATK